MNSLKRRTREIAVLVVDRLDPGAIDRQQFPAEQIQLAAKQHKLAEDRAECVAVVAPEVSDRLEVRAQMPQQPDHLDVAVRLGFEPPARPHPVQVAVDVELQEIPGQIAGAAGRLRHHANKACSAEIQPIHKGIDEANGVIWADVLVQRFRQEQSLRSVVT